MDYEIVLKSGRRFTPNRGIIGISPELKLFEGWDGDLDGWEPFTREEKMEIASLVIARWQALLFELSK